MRSDTIKPVGRIAIMPDRFTADCAVATDSEDLRTDDLCNFDVTSLANYLKLQYVSSNGVIKKNYSREKCDPACDTLPPRLQDAVNLCHDGVPREFFSLFFRRQLFSHI